MCILGLIGDLIGDQVMGSPGSLDVSHMVIQARKLLVFNWIQSTPPTIKENTNGLSNIIRLVKKKK